MKTSTPNYILLRISIHTLATTEISEKCVVFLRSKNQKELWKIVFSKNEKKKWKVKVIVIHYSYTIVPTGFL